jgi:hypothetical protein
MVLNGTIKALLYTSVKSVRDDISNIRRHVKAIRRLIRLEARPLVDSGEAIPLIYPSILVE